MKMSWIRLSFLMVPVLFVACQTPDKDTIGQLSRVRIEIKDEKIEGGLEKAMAGYQRFLEETPDSALTPEAIRRLADLKIEKEYGFTQGLEFATSMPATLLPAPERVTPVHMTQAHGTGTADEEVLTHLPLYDESSEEFERRTTSEQQLATTDSEEDLERAGTLEAIELYRKLLTDYPHYERNDQVLYQMSRGYEELGRIEEAMEVMNQLVHGFPHSRYFDEVQFRRAEYFFTRRRYLDAEEAYASIVKMGMGSFYYDLALYKLGWTFYKQELYEDGVHKFIALLDHKVALGYDFDQTEDESESKRLEDTFRVISLSFSNLGGTDSVVEYFSRHGKRGYEDRVYSNLGEFYFDKRRYSDAATTYNAFVSRNPFHRVSPLFHMRVIEIYIVGAFPSLVIDSKKQFANNYGLKAQYWRYYEPEARPEVLGFLKTNLTDLANHYHSLYQNLERAEEKPANFQEARHWYREFLASFPMEIESPGINYQLADLFLENRSLMEAAVEYEKTAYGYPLHERSSKAGYAAIYAYREHLRIIPPAGRDPIKREVVRSSIQFADGFPEHEKAAIVLGAAVDDLYDMKDHEQAVNVAHKLIEMFPEAETDVLRSAWLVVAHSSYELLRYSDAEGAYVNVLALLPAGDKRRNDLIDNLAASIYRQGEQAIEIEDYRAAANHFLRVGRMAPTSGIRASADYDAAAALIHLQDWKMAASVLLDFRGMFPGHQLQPEVTKKIAFVYREDGQLSLAAGEYERIERESGDEEIRREALLLAAELYEEVGDKDRVLKVYRRYVGYFPRPVELNLETRNKIAEILKAENDQRNYLNELRQIVAIDGSAGQARTARTRYLAARAALVLTEPRYDQFVEVRLVQPFETNLRIKRDLMRTAMQEFGKLLEYQVGDVTAAATFYLAEIYDHFSKSLMESERPEGLSPLEMEQYELAIEEQAYPFEEQAIEIHEKNLQLIAAGIYNAWIDKSLEKLAESVPARYAKPEESSGIISSLDTFIFEIHRPESAEPPVSEEQAPVAAVQPAEKGQDEGMKVAGDVPGNNEPAPPVAEEQTSVAGLLAEEKSGEEMEIAAAGDASGTHEAVPPGSEEQAPVAAVQPAEKGQDEEMQAALAGEEAFDSNEEVQPEVTARAMAGRTGE
jgi:cellulose synthase operon protein C